jgi:hypothetical protein
MHLRAVWCRRCSLRPPSCATRTMRWSIPTISIRATTPTSSASPKMCWRGSKGAEEALLFPSGMAAIAALFRTLPNGGSIVVQSGIYWGTTKWLRDFSARRADRAARGGSVRCLTRSNRLLCSTHSSGYLVFIETPVESVAQDPSTSPMPPDAPMRLAPCWRSIPPPQPRCCKRPLEHGADIVMHSATKGINGHSDVLAGVLATAAHRRHRSGPASRPTDTMPARCIGPFEAWLLLRGMRTLPLRVERMSANAFKLATWLKAHPKVADVYYPGLESHPGHDIAKRGRCRAVSAAFCHSWFRAARRKPSKRSRQAQAVSPRHLIGRRRKPGRAPPHHRTAHRHPRKPDPCFRGHRGR